MAYLLGKDLKIYTVSGNSEALRGLAQSCQINIDIEQIPVSSPTSGRWKEFDVGDVGWSISTNELVMPAFSYPNVTAKWKIRVRTTTGANARYLEGYVHWEKWNFVGNVGSLAKISTVLRGTGELSDVHPSS